MKKNLLFVAAALIAGTTFVNAQGGGGGGFQRRTVEERVAVIHQKMDSAFKFDAARQAKIDSVFAGFYRSTDRVREEVMSSGDRSAMREKMQPLMDARDKDLQSLMGDDKYKVWKEGIEPTMMRRGPGGPPRQ